MKRTWLTVAVIGCAVAAGCKSKPKAGSGSAASTGSGSAGSAEGSAMGSDVGSAAGSGEGSGSAAAGWLPGKLDDKHGVVFAEKQGGDVKGLADGLQVEVVEVKDMMVGSEEDGEVKVKSPAGATVSLPADRVIIEDALKRSDDGKYAVFAPVVACGDFCHTVLWFIAADGKRVKLGEAGVDVNATYAPDGSSAAVGSGNMWVVTLADFKVKGIDGYTSPAYGPDGTLYVRNSSGSAFKLEGDKPKQVWKAPKHETDDEEMGPPDDPRPVSFKDGKPVFDEPFWDGPPTP